VKSLNVSAARTIGCLAMGDRSNRKPPRAPPADTDDPDTDDSHRKTGRVRFDERGHAVWEWAVRTGQYDRNASTSRVRALTEDPVKLEIADALEKGPKPNAPSGNPYDRPTLAPKENRRPRVDLRTRDPKSLKPHGRPGTDRKG
jgi:hypothetical protein